MIRFHTDSMAVWSESMHVYHSAVNAHCNNYSYDIEVCIFDYNTHNTKSTFTRRPLFFGIYRLPDDWYYIHETMVVQMTWVWTFSTLIAIIRACARWALFVVTLTNTVHLIYIYIFNGHINFGCMRYIILRNAFVCRVAFKHKLQTCLSNSNCHQDEDPAVSQLTQVWPTHHRYQEWKLLHFYNTWLLQPGT